MERTFEDMFTEKYIDDLQTLLKLINEGAPLEMINKITYRKINAVKTYRKALKANGNLEASK